MILFGNPSDHQDDRPMFQNDHLVRVCMPGSFIEQRRGRIEKVK